MWLLPALPLTITVSGCPSPTPPVAARSIATCFTLVPERSLTVIVSAPLNAAIWIFSMPLRSIVTVPTSRNSVARLPLAETSMCSPMLEPLKTSVSVPAPPSTTSLPSPGFQMNVSLPLPSNATSLPRPPVTVSLPEPPISKSLPSPPSRMSLPPPPSIVSLPAPPSMISAAFEGRGIPVEVTVEETKDGMMISSAPVPIKLAIIDFLTMLLCASLQCAAARNSGDATTCTSSVWRMPGS